MSAREEATIQIAVRRSSQPDLRRVAFAVTVIFGAAELVTWDPGSATPWFLAMVINVLLAAAGGVLAYRAARKFGPDESARHVWLLIAFMGVADCGVLISFSLPRILGVFQGIVPLTVVTSLLTTLSRGVMLPLALWMMVRVYHRSRLGFRLVRQDYVSMAVVAALGILSLALVGNVARSQLFIDDPGLVRLLRGIGMVLLPAMVLTSVFGVMIWQYATQMGGGLVAKAWRCVLLCTVLWLARFAFLGALNFFYGMEANHRPTAVEMISFWAVMASEYLLFAGASYQYEACTSSVPVDQEELQALAEQFEKESANVCR